MFFFYFKWNVLAEYIHWNFSRARPFFDQSTESRTTFISIQSYGIHIIYISMYWVLWEHYRNKANQSMQSMQFRSVAGSVRPQPHTTTTNFASDDNVKCCRLAIFFFVLLFCKTLVAAAFAGPYYYCSLAWPSLRIELYRKLWTESPLMNTIFVSVFVRSIWNSRWLYGGLFNWTFINWDYRTQSKWKYWENQIYLHVALLIVRWLFFFSNIVGK